MTRRFTGWHMTAVLIAMFGTITAVNFTMARLAVSTFGGTVVDNSYVASQAFNRWLAEARDQQALGWSARMGSEGRRLAVEVRRRGAPVAGASVTAIVSHPLGRSADRMLVLAPAGNGRFRSAEALPAGRWQVRVIVRADGHEARFEDQVQG